MASRNVGRRRADPRANRRRGLDIPAGHGHGHGHGHGDHVVDTSVVDSDAIVARRVRIVVASVLFPLIAAALEVDDLTLDRLRQCAALLFLGANDFNSLHAVTGLHAARILSDFAVDRRVFAREVWRALLALYLSLDRPEVPSPASAAELTAEDLPDWNAVLAAAVANDDEHVIKLVFSCLSESRAGGGRLYRYLAARKAGLLGVAESEPVAGAEESAPSDHASA